MLQIPGLVDSVLSEMDEALRLEVGTQNLYHLPVHALHLPPGPLAQLVAAEEEIKEPAEDGKGQDGHDPGDLIGRFTAPVHDPKDRHDAQGHAYPVKGQEKLVEPQQHDHQHGDLDEEEDPHQHRPVKEQRDQFLHIRLTVTSVFPLQVFPMSACRLGMLQDHVLLPQQILQLPDQGRM